MKFDPFLTPYKKIVNNSRRIRDLNIKAKSREKDRQKLLYINFANDFLNMTPEAQAIKAPN